MAGDAEGALAAWRLDRRRANETTIAERRGSVTAAIRDLSVRRFQIEVVQWWRTCCEPGIVDGPANAGLARAVVRLDTTTGSQHYMFDVLARETTYWGDATGSPPHEWTLRDVYPTGEAPLFARFASTETRFPEAVAAVREFHERYGQALVTCDIQRLWDRYPALASGEDIARGINSEGLHVPLLCAMRITAAHFELERNEPLRVHEHAGGVDVIVHGLEWFDLADGGNSGGEFKKTFTLRQSGGSWTIVRTDEVTLAEWHQQGH